MKSTGLATFISILFVPIIRGQQNGLVKNTQNIETNSAALQQLPLHTKFNSVPRFLNQNGNGNENILPNYLNQHQVQTQMNVPTAVLNLEQRQESPDLKQQSLHLQQPLLPQQSLQVQPITQFHQPLQAHQPLQLQQPFETIQPLQAGQPTKFQQPLQSQQTIQPIVLQQSTPQQMPINNQNLDFGQSSHMRQENNFQSSPQLNLKLVPTNLQAPKNVEQSLKTHNSNIQPLLGPIVGSVTNSQVSDKSLDLSSIRYQIASQQSPSTFLSKSPIVSHNPSIALIPSYSINPTEQTYLSPYNYVKPSSEIQPVVVDSAKVINTLPALSSPTLSTVPIIPAQNANMHMYYYNQQGTDPKQNVFINQNSGFNYPQQPHISASPVQGHATLALMPNQSPILSSIPIIQAPSVLPRYTFSSSYPTNTVVAPAYTNEISKPSNLKSFLPLIFNLLREKIASCGCRNGCTNECKKKSKDDGPEVSSGYSSQKHYGALNDKALSVLSTMSEEADGIECHRERKNCLNAEADPELSEESQEDDDSDEEDSDDDDD